MRIESPSATICLVKLEGIPPIAFVSQNCELLWDASCRLLWFGSWTSRSIHRDKIRFPRDTIARRTERWHHFTRLGHLLILRYQPWYVQWKIESCLSSRLRSPHFVMPTSPLANWLRFRLGIAPKRNLVSWILKGLLPVSRRDKEQPSDVSNEWGRAMQFVGRQAW